MYLIMAKTRMTPFSRLLLFLLVFLPLAYFGASYYNGEDPVANIKNALGMNDSPRTEQPSGSTTSNSSDNKPATFENVQDLRDEITELKVDLAVTKEKLARCQADNVE
ncbi:hypothetical protein FUA23_16450 [Neolewinella aurantiaca]|uniref:Uncharacterized protein n=1 Tax=Neolewinella aurantiaca TaxID=2602767 RepID=A0A5C7FD74_9BACT|nr:hypothetical protein [Neolewinella aurantiaca]TXF88071.1 hypothetical protein FUA23_16450 [Neolewinella aurantiaca]